MPLALGQQEKVTTTPNDTRHAWDPVQRFYAAQNGDIQLGGWALGNFSLEGLYKEHLAFRNRWSFSNCGFDLASYKGTWLYFEQHRHMDYLVMIDSEYESLKEFVTQTTFHPLALITHPHVIVIKSRDRVGPRRARKVWVPRPAWWDSGWTFTKDIARKGMFAYFIMFIELDYPLMVKYVESENYLDQEEVSWWKSANQKWKEDWDSYILSTLSETEPASKADLVRPDKSKVIHINQGPLMPRYNAIFVGTNWQLLMFYKSIWRWGGRNLTMKKICDPVLL